MPAARSLLAAAAVASAALSLAACGADGSSVGPASTAQSLTPVTTAAAPAAPGTTQAAPAPATTSTQSSTSSSSSSSSGSSAAPSSSVTTAGPVAQAPVGGGTSDCGSAAGGFVRQITTDAGCSTAVRVARGWVASIQDGKDPAGVITVRAGSAFACSARFNGNRAAVLCERGGDPKQPRVAFISQP